MQRYLKFSCNLSLVVLLGTSCQKETLLIPDQPAQVALTSGRGRSSSSPPSNRSNNNTGSGSGNSSTGNNSSNKDKPHESFVTSYSATSIKYQNGKEVGTTTSGMGVYEDKSSLVIVKRKPDKRSADEPGGVVITEYSAKKIKFSGDKKGEESVKRGVIYEDGTQTFKWEVKPGGSTGGSQRVN